MVHIKKSVKKDVPALETEDIPGISRILERITFVKMRNKIAHPKAITQRIKKETKFKVVCSSFKDVR